MTCRPSLPLAVSERLFLTSLMLQRDGHWRVLMRARDACAGALKSDNLRSTVSPTGSFLIVSPSVSDTSLLRPGFTTAAPPTVSIALLTRYLCPKSVCIGHSAEDARLQFPPGRCVHLPGAVEDLLVRLSPGQAIANLRDCWAAACLQSLWKIPVPRERSPQ